MTEIVETNTGTERDEYKVLVSPNFTSLMYEVEKLVQNGWALSSTNYPVDNVLTYEVHLEKNKQTMARLKSRYESAVEGKPVWSKEDAQANVAKARETRAKKLAEQKAAEAQQ